MNRRAGLALAYSCVLGPALSAAGVLLDQLWLLVALAPILPANRYVRRHLEPRYESEGERERAAAAVFEGVHERDFPDEGDGRLREVEFALDHPTVIDRLRFPTRLGLHLRIVSTVCSLGGFAMLLLGVPDHPWLGALGVFTIFAASRANARNVARFLQPRFPQPADDEDRARWSRYHRRTEVGACTAVLVLVVVVVMGR